jgi:hypothetical protein
VAGGFEAVACAGLAAAHPHIRTPANPHAGTAEVSVNWLLACPEALPHAWRRVAAARTAARATTITTGDPDFQRLELRVGDATCALSAADAAAIIAGFA